MIDAMSLTHALTVATKQMISGDLFTREAFMAPLRAVLAVSGCDKANVAHALTCLLEAMDPAPSLVMQVGIAGALPVTGGEEGAHVGDLVLAREEIYADTGSSSPGGWMSAEEIGLPVAQVDGRELGNRFVLNKRLVEVAARTLAGTARGAGETGKVQGFGLLGGRRVIAGPCVTVSRMTGLRAEGEELARRWNAVAESMEGAAAAHVCALYAVPFLEIRGISNMVIDRDRSSWRVEEAVAVAGEAALTLCRTLDSLVCSPSEGART